jgi:hypothetical protein
MLLPPEYAWIGLVVMGSLFVFVADLIGNMLTFENRVLNALTTAIVFSAAFAFFIYFRYGSVMLTDWGVAVMHR